MPGFMYLAIGLLVSAIAPHTVLAVDKTRFPELVAQLKSAATQLDRLALLPKDEDWLFDFNAQPYSTFSPGGVINANAATFPATVGNGITMAMLNLGPCSILPPHFHPRASNYVVAIHGSTRTYMIEENGARVITQTLTPGKMTIFPQASLHTMYNMGCDNAQLISALNNEDSGTTNFLTNFFNIPAETLLEAAFGYQDLDVNGTSSQIPPVGTGSNYGPKECLARCARANGGMPPNATYGAPPTAAFSYDGKA